MQHQKSSKKFKRDRDQRKAFFKTILGSLILHEKIETTEAKAKEIKKNIDQLINRAKLAKDEAQKVQVKRILSKSLPSVAVKKITGEFADKFAKRKSGYTRVIKLAPRKSDNARMALIEFVD
jgi:large subunit ribosomal protein L17